MNMTYLDPNMVPAALKAGYYGKKFKACVVTDVTIPCTAGLWEGGSRDTYRVVRLDDGRIVDAVNHNAAPWNSERRDHHVNLEPGIVVVEHTIFCGKDLGLTFYVHPDNAAKLLPKPTETLSPYERLVLTATKSLKSSYAGRDRYDNARNEYHCEKIWAGSAYPTREQWNETKLALIGKGLLNKAGAITIAGRNALT